MLKFLMVGCYGIACAMLLVLAIGSGVTVITTVGLAILKLTDHLHHGWLVVFSPILIVVSGWIICGFFGLLGLICQVSCNK